MAEDLENMTNEKKLKLTTYYAVSKTCDELGQENTYVGPFTITKEAKELITEFIWKKLDVYAQDLEAFANHAKRNNISGEDVKLLFRRSPKLLEEFIKMDELEKVDNQNRKRKRQTDVAGTDED